MHKVGDKVVVINGKNAGVDENHRIQEGVTEVTHVYGDGYLLVRHKEVFFKGEWNTQEGNWCIHSECVVSLNKTENKLIKILYGVEQ